MTIRAEDGVGEWEAELGWVDELCGGSDCADGGVW